MQNQNFFVAETDAKGSINNPSSWETVAAKSLTAAKRAASRAQMFQGTAVFVGQLFGGSIKTVAVKRDDAINMALKGTWSNVFS